MDGHVFSQIYRIHWDIVCPTGSALLSVGLGTAAVAHPLLRTDHSQCQTLAWLGLIGLMCTFIFFSFLLMNILS